MSRRLGLLISLLCSLVLIPFVLWEQNLSSLINNVVDNKSTPILVGSLIVGLLAFDCLLPTPSSLISAVSSLYFEFPISVALIFSGMSLGVIIGYSVGAQMMRLPHLRHLLSQQEIGTLDNWLQRYGWLTFCLVRPVPVLAEVSVMLAGVSRISFSKVLLFTSPANLLIATAYSLLFAST